MVACVDVSRTVLSGPFTLLLPKTSNDKFSKGAGLLV